MATFEAAQHTGADNLDWQITCSECGDVLEGEIDWINGTVSARLYQHQTYQVNAYRTDIEVGMATFAPGDSYQDEFETMETVESGSVEVDHDTVDYYDTERSQVCPECDYSNITLCLKASFLGSSEDDNSYLWLDLEEDCYTATGYRGGPAFEWLKALHAVIGGEEVVPITYGVEIDIPAVSASELDQLQAQLKGMQE